ncbi:MAG: transposase, partial [Planctomycetaceae bacterium]|nr:transposase [Planctomycetaceae bacterium]
MTSSSTIRPRASRLIREVKFLAEYKGNKTTSNYGKRLLKQIRLMFSTIHQRDELSYRSWIRRMNKHKRAILGTSQRKIPDNKDAINLAQRLRDWNEEYFLFIRSGLFPTNNLAEQTIRQVVLDRRITQGTKDEKGNFW